MLRCSRSIGAEQLGDAVDERLDPQKADIAMALGLRGEMLAAAEADLEPDLLRRRRKEAARIDRRARFEGESDPRQDLVQKPPGFGTQPGALAPAVEEPPIGRVGGCRPRAQLKARRSSAARSVRSHEKPPSSSAARPKCPYAEVRA